MHAPGCPVVIVGTHLDVVSVKDDISQNVYQLYSDNSSYPTIGGVSCISNTHGSLKELRSKIYFVAMHLHINQKNRC